VGEERGLASARAESTPPDNTYAGRRFPSGEKRQGEKKKKKGSPRGPEKPGSWEGSRESSCRPGRMVPSTGRGSPRRLQAVLLESKGPFTRLWGRMLTNSIPGGSPVGHGAADMGQAPVGEGGFHRRGQLEALAGVPEQEAPALQIPPPLTRGLGT